VEIDRDNGIDKAGAMAGRLGALEEQSNKLNVPISYVDQVYTLKHHITLVKGKLKGPEPTPIQGDSA